MNSTDKARSLTQEDMDAAMAQLKRELEDPRVAKLLGVEPKPARKHRPGYRPKPDYAGLRQWRRARSTGTYVGVYDGVAAGFDTDGGRWSTVCEDHSWIVSHETLALALRHAPCPDEWCEVCSGEEVPS